MLPAQAQADRRGGVRRTKGRGGFRAVAVVFGAVMCAGALAGCDAETTTALNSGIHLPDGTHLTEPPLPAEIEELDRETASLVREHRADVLEAMGDPERWLTLGMVYHAHLQYEPARQCYQAATALKSVDPRAPYLDALVLARLGDRSAAIERMHEANELAPEHAATAWRLAQWYMESGEIDAAATWSERAMRRSPDDVSARLVRARVLLQQDRHDAAAAALEELAVAQPDDRYVRLLLGTAYRGIGRFEDAARELERGRGAEPTWHDAWMREMQAYYAGFRAEMMRALALLRANDPAAIERFEALREREPGNVDVLVNLSIAHRRQSEPEKALEVLSEAAALEPGRYLVQFHLAATHRQMAVSVSDSDDAHASELLAQAAEHARTAIEIQPRDPSGHGLLGETQRLAGALHEAAVAYQRAAELEPSNPFWMLRRGTVMMELERWPEAIDSLQRTAERMPDNPGVLVLLAKAQVQAGRHQDAQQTLRHGNRTFPDRSEWRLMLDELERLAAGSMQPSP